MPIVFLASECISPDLTAIALSLYCVEKQFKGGKMSATNGVSMFDRGVFEVEMGFLEGGAKEIDMIMQGIRTAGIVVGATAGLIAFVFANAAFRGAGCTLGFSFILLAPAALCAAVAFDAYKVVRCCSIVINEAVSRSGAVSTIIHDVKDIGSYLSSGKPVWMNDVERELNGSAFLRITKFIPAN